MPLVKETLEGIVERVRMEFPAAAQTLRQQVTGEDDAEDHLIAEDAVDEHGMVRKRTKTLTPRVS